MTTKKSLPSAFRDLDAFVDEWSLATEKERCLKLLDTGLDDLRAFVEAMQPRAEAAIAYLSQFPLDDFPEDARNLYELLVTFVETAHPIELKWSDTTNTEALTPNRLQFNGPSATPIEPIQHGSIASAPPTKVFMS